MVNFLIGLILGASVGMFIVGLFAGNRGEYEDTACLCKFCTTRECDEDDTN